MTFQPIPLSGRAREVVARANRVVPALLVDLLVTAVAEAGVLWGVAASQQYNGHPWSWWVWAWALPLPLALLWRRSAPFAVFWITGLGTLLLSVFANLAITWNHSCEFMLLVAMATVAYYRDGWRFWLPAACSVGADFVFVAHQGIGRTMVSTLVTAMAFVAGRLAAQQRDLARLMADRVHEAELAVQARTAQAAAEERTRIARDMHDILAHAVSLMIVQAEAGAAVLHQDAKKAETAFDAIADGGRDALTQLRRMLGVLREDDTLALSPQPKIGELPRLVETVRTTRIDVRMVVVGDPRRLPPDTEVAVYRTAQEALTNMVKHSRADRAELRLDWTPEALTLRMTDDGIGPRAGATDSGRGLIGIRERITSCGGTVHTGAGPDGRGFQLLVRIPAAAEEHAPRTRH
ncbi:sensor histidine kinase [Actinospica sp.]|jgi:signal transduction histidine kinase|uniref:sensor histidine kinase n=1 Tax=Actinospica sp. TaxID=1872142 RepID=UPI002C93DD9C|nr:sensor histidine kinase [Actinospica sp.]HWG27518.1 sensor histidine kinase [Actinospica sp.]